MTDCSSYLERHCCWTMFNQGTARNQVQYLHITVKWIDNLIRKWKGQIWVLFDGRRCSQTFYIQINKKNVEEKRWIMATWLDGHLALNHQVTFPWGPAVNLWKEIIINNVDLCLHKCMHTDTHIQTHTQNVSCVKRSIM